MGLYINTNGSLGNELGASKNALDFIIPPEIKGDNFYHLLNSVAKLSEVKNILEIGSSSGQGSTDAFVQAIRSRSDSSEVNLFCMEISRVRYSKLQEVYKTYNFVKCYNLSSVASDEFPSESEIVSFYNYIRTTLNYYPLQTVLGWYHQDLSYINQNGLAINGIKFIKQENKLSVFDLVLIDGSEFTGERDLWSVMGSKFIALDDVNSFKCWNAYQILSHHSSYKLVCCDLTTRNGYAFFERIF
jgi:hypothetical protein